eukprot:CAMPEP_0196141244 /NCGR_PEP_ID=MMETSP0910-20130528/9274_1 /TAXON_ID=49265 /ORGANISM="Thalassiosira rotula, Strain GSO102" /LENGTH=76 /DNA_ID=CAMNT_0041402349 /DNA_START=15 /DNA_END=242 /DNA_ORIENTATION=-
MIATRLLHTTLRSSRARAATATTTTTTTTAPNPTTATSPHLPRGISTTSTNRDGDAASSHKTLPRVTERRPTETGR